MKRTRILVVIMLAVLMAIFCLSACNQADNVKHNIQQDADSFNTYRKVTVINLRSDKVLLTVEGFISIKDSTAKELAIIIKVAESEYKMHYVYVGSGIVYLVEQIENTTTDPYHWKIVIFAVVPEFTNGD